MRIIKNILFKLLLMLSISLFALSVVHAEDETVTVPYSITGVDATDVDVVVDGKATKLDDNLTFKKGDEKTKEITITIKENKTFDQDKNFNFEIKESPQEVTLTGDKKFTGKILKDSPNNTSKVNINPNRPPVAEDDTPTLSADSKSTVIKVLDNDTDPDKDKLTVTAINNSNVKGFVGLYNGVISYDPNNKFNEVEKGKTTTDTFSYTVSDGKGGEAKATVTITIEGVKEAPKSDNTPPVANDDTHPKTPLPANWASTETIDVLKNDTDADGDTLTVIKLDYSGTKASVTLTNGVVDYALKVEFDGDSKLIGELGDIEKGKTVTDTFSYTVSDGKGGEDTATVTITIEGVKEPVKADSSSPITVTITPPTSLKVKEGTGGDTTKLIFKAQTSRSLNNSDWGGTVGIDYEIKPIGQTNDADVKGIGKGALVINEQSNQLTIEINHDAEGESDEEFEVIFTGVKIYRGRFSSVARAARSGPLIDPKTGKLIEVNFATANPKYKVTIQNDDEIKSSEGSSDTPAASTDAKTAKKVISIAPKKETYKQSEDTEIIFTVTLSCPDGYPEECSANECAKDKASCPTMTVCGTGTQQISEGVCECELGFDSYKVVDGVAKCSSGSNY